MILLRHGQSAFNLHYGATGVDPGIPDAPLTELGHRQAEEAAEALVGEGVRRILCSPYTRALQTAAPVAARLRLPVTVTALVRERFGASCDIGTGSAALAAAWPHLDFGAIEEVWWPGEEEPHDAFEARTAAFLAEMDAHPDWAHTLVVCHWGVIQALTGRSLSNGEWVRLERGPAA
ncbi:Phosphoglycerate mutase [Methylobacterium sp. 4-46]|uniref:histidine phosphatase family protein n=1 Tax=unclassified Methylobacterium TaxID=2615210 RepID=UPI000152C8EF|nr:MULTISPECIES: histidine phosphatase family protein [Methylobacterium]ACA17111.1 Phosphoglycerate mutase [Methylobacterium sp. 4-46]WFT82796.1 phosphoglycerate mutase family protein [Methylobacterium nodulans]